MELLGFFVTRDSIAHLIFEIKLHHLWDDDVERVFSDFFDATASVDTKPVAKLLVKLATGGKATFWLYKQWVWGIGNKWRNAHG